MTYRIDGGAPAGTNILPGEDGCLTTSIKMINTTMLGKSRTKPNGIEIEEFPFIFMRLLKNDNLDRGVLLSFFQSSSVGALGVEGKRLSKLWTRPLPAAVFSVISRTQRKVDQSGWELSIIVMHVYVVDQTACMGFSLIKPVYRTHWWYCSESCNARRKWLIG